MRRGCANERRTDATSCPLFEARPPCSHGVCVALYSHCAWARRGDLRDCLGKPFAEDWNFHNHKLRVLLETCRGMEYLHSLDPVICHRDLKAENVLVTEHLQCKISDFGESRDIVEATMTCVGTPYYIAPEVFRGEHYDESADVFSFGIIMCCVAHGGDLADFFTKAYERMGVSGETSGMAVPSKIAMGWRPTFPQEWEDELPTLTKLIKRCWHAAHAHRPTMPEIHEILDKFWSTNKFFVADQHKHERDVKKRVSLELRKKSNARKESRKIKRETQEKLANEAAAMGVADLLKDEIGSANGENSPVAPASPKIKSGLSLVDRLKIARQEEEEDKRVATLKLEAKDLLGELPGAVDDEDDSGNDSSDFDDAPEEEMSMMTIRTKKATAALTGAKVDEETNEYSHLPKSELIAMLTNAKDDLRKVEVEHGRMKQALTKAAPREAEKILLETHHHHRKVSLERRKSSNFLLAESTMNYQFNIMAQPAKDVGQRKSMFGGGAGAAGGAGEADGGGGGEGSPAKGSAGTPANHSRGLGKEEGGGEVGEAAAAPVKEPVVREFTE